MPELILRATRAAVGLAIKRRWGFFRKIFGRRASAECPKEWIAVRFKLSTSGQFGSLEERAMVHRFSDSLASVIEDQQIGVFDGDEYGNGEGALFMYGPNADRLFEAVYLLLSTWSPVKGGYAIKRYGVPERSERIEF
jgi:hypothetical protein